MKFQNQNTFFAFGLIARDQDHNKWFTIENGQIGNRFFSKDSQST